MGLSSRKSIFDHGKIILRELAREEEMSDFSDLKHLENQPLIDFEKAIKEATPRMSGSAKMIMAIRAELKKRGLKWSYEADTWISGS